MSYSIIITTMIFEHFCVICTLIAGGYSLSADISTSPKVKTLNGTYVGRHLSSWDQDVFLGVPFAEPPVGELRFKLPRGLNNKFQEERKATEYGPSCMQYGQNYTLSEDCLSLNVVRPAGNFKKPLPVLYVLLETFGAFNQLLTDYFQCLDLWWWSLLGKLC